MASCSYRTIIAIGHNTISLRSHISRPQPRYYHKREGFTLALHPIICLRVSPHTLTNVPDLNTRSSQRRFAEHLSIPLSGSFPYRGLVYRFTLSFLGSQTGSAKGGAIRSINSTNRKGRAKELGPSRAQNKGSGPLITVPLSFHVLPNHERGKRVGGQTKKGFWALF